MEKSELKSNSNEKLSHDKHSTHEDNTSRSTVALDRWNKLLGSVGKIKAWNSKTGESASALITLPPRKNSKLRSEGGSSTSSSAASSPVPSRHSASPSKKLSPQLTALKSPLANLRKTRSSSISAMVPRRGSSPSNLLGATQMLSSSAATPSPLPSGDSFTLVTRSLRRVKSERYDNSWDCPVFWHDNTQPRTTASTPLLSSAVELDEIRRTVTSPAGLKASDINSAHDLELKNSSELLGQLKAISAQRSKSRRKIHRLRDKDKDKDKDKEKDKHKERRPRDSMLLSPSSSDSMDLSTPRDLSELTTPRERSGTIDTHMLRMMQEMHADPNKAPPKKLSRQDKESSAFNLHLATTVAQKSAAVDLVVPITKHPYLDISRIEWGQRDEDETVRRFGLLTTSRSLASLTPRAVGENKIILAGNLTQLVNVAVNPHAAYDNFLRIMVLTHRHVLSSHEFLDKLIRRYHIKPLKGQEDSIEFTHHKELLQEGVITMLQSWMDLHFDDFVGNEKVLESFQQFVHHLEKGSDKDRDFVQLLNRSMARQYRLLEDAERNLLKHTPLLQQFIETEMTLAQGASMTGPLKLTRMTPVPVNAVAVSSMSLLDFHPLELAKQLALREWSYFQRAEIEEYIHLRWTKANKNKSAPNILQLIRRFNELSYWVASEIVSTVNKKKRVVVLTRFLQIAKYCRDMNNFQVVMAIYCGLNMQAIQRLRKTWKGVGKEHIALLKELDQLFEAAENYKHYRTRIRAAIDENQPVLPFQGVYLKSLVFIEENHDKTERGLLNVEKLEMLYKVLYEIRMCQRYPFPFTEVPQIQDYLTNLEAMTDDELYKNSKQCEENTSETPNQLRKSVKLKKKI